MVAVRRLGIVKTTRVVAIGFLHEVRRAFAARVDDARALWDVAAASRVKPKAWTMVKGPFLDSIVTTRGGRELRVSFGADCDGYHGFTLRIDDRVVQMAHLRNEQRAERRLARLVVAVKAQNKLLLSVE